MIELTVVLLTSFQHMVWFYFYETLVLFSGMGMKLKDKIMLHCFKEMKR